VSRANQNKGRARKCPCPVAQLAAQLETLCARHLRADNASVRDDKSGAADLAAYDFERDAIAERASYLTATSATGAALQVALASADADCLVGSEFVNRVEAEAMQYRMNRLLVAAERYLQGTGAVLPPTVAEYHMGNRG
jgi:hypothetical protein